jgi:hypothetical protein
MREKLNYLGASNTARIQPKVKIPPRNSGHGRKRLPVKRVLQHRGLPSRRPSPATVRPLAESALINEHYGATLPLGFFLSLGQRFFFQRSMAVSSLCSARPVGRWQLQPSLPNTHQTCPGWYFTPQRCSISSATRSSVHSSVSYPSAWGPRLSSRSIRLKSAPLSRDLRPARPAFFRPARPCFSICWAHRFTDWRWAPTCRATSASFNPCFRSAWARNRRCSNASKSLLTPRAFPMQCIIAENASDVTIFYEIQ